VYFMMNVLTNDATFCVVPLTIYDSKLLKIEFSLLSKHYDIALADPMEELHKEARLNL
jgi:hypothetical protein